MTKQLVRFSLLATTITICGMASGASAAIVVNEIMNNPAAVSDANGEWFELHNTGPEAFDLEGCTISDNDTDSHVIANGGPLVIPAGGYLILGINGDSGTNGGVTVDYVYSAFFLANGADEVVVLDTGGVELDRVEYDGGPNFPDPNGASMCLMDPGLDNNVGSNWTTSTTAFGAGDFGTPGSMNVCQSVPAQPKTWTNIKTLFR